MDGNRFGCNRAGSSSLYKSTLSVLRPCQEASFTTFVLTIHVNTFPTWKSTPSMATTAIYVLNAFDLSCFKSPLSLTRSVPLISCDYRPGFFWIEVCHLKWALVNLFFSGFMSLIVPIFRRYLHKFAPLCRWRIMSTSDGT